MKYGLKVKLRLAVSKRRVSELGRLSMETLTIRPKLCLGTRAHPGLTRLYDDFAEHPNDAEMTTLVGQESHSTIQHWT
jgi:hypothetical protein